MMHIARVMFNDAEHLPARVFGLLDLLDRPVTAQSVFKYLKGCRESIVVLPMEPSFVRVGDVYKNTVTLEIRSGDIPEDLVFSVLFDRISKLIHGEGIESPDNGNPFHYREAVEGYDFVFSIDNLRLS